MRMTSGCRAGVVAVVFALLLIACAMQFGSSVGENDLGGVVTSHAAVAPGSARAIKH